MTIIVAVNFGDYVLMGADKRASSLDGSYFDDDNEKIVKTNIGLITGYGAADLLIDVKEQIRISNIENTDDIKSIIKKEQSSKLLKYSLINGLTKIFNDSENIRDPKDNINETRWVLSYIGNVDNVNKMRLVHYNPLLEDGSFEIIEEKDTFVSIPGRMDYELFLEMKNDFLGKIDYENKKEPLFNIKLIKNFINEISKKSNSVSSSCDVGIHQFIDGEKEVYTPINHNS